MCVEASGVKTCSTPCVAGHGGRVVGVGARPSPPRATRNVHEGKLSVWPPTRDPLLQLLTVWLVKTAHFEKL